MLRSKGAPLPLGSDSKGKPRLQSFMNTANAVTPPATNAPEKVIMETKRLQLSTVPTTTANSLLNALPVNTPRRARLTALLQVDTSRKSSPTAKPSSHSDVTNTLSVTPPLTLTGLNIGLDDKHSKAVAKTTQTNNSLTGIRHTKSLSQDTITLFLKPTTESEKTIEEKNSLLLTTIQQIAKTLHFNHPINIPSLPNPKKQFEKLQLLRHDILSALLNNYSSHLDPHIRHLIENGANLTHVDINNEHEYGSFAIPVDSLQLAIIKKLPLDLIKLLFSKQTFHYDSFTIFNCHEKSWHPLILAALYSNYEILEYLSDKFTQDQVRIARQQMNVLWEKIQNIKSLTVYLGWQKITLTCPLLASASVKLLNHELEFRRKMNEYMQIKKNKHRRSSSLSLNHSIYTGIYTTIPDQTVICAKTQIETILRGEEDAKSVNEQNKHKIYQYKELYVQMMRDPLYNDNYIYTNGISDTTIASICACLFNYKAPQQYADIKIVFISGIQERIVLLLSTLKNEKDYAKTCHEIFNHSVFLSDHNLYGVPNKWRKIVEDEVTLHPLKTINATI